MIFETDRLYVTKWKRDDLQALHDLYNDTAIKGSILPQLTIEETRPFLKSNWFATVARLLLADILLSKNRAINVWAFYFLRGIIQPGVEIGYSLKRNHWKKGYATEVVRESINWLFESKGFYSIYAITDSQNESSKKVLLRCGFRPGKYFTENGEDLNLFSLRYSES